MTTHKITTRPDHRGGGRYTYSYLCSCGAKGFGHQSTAEAKKAGRKHVPKEASRR